MEDSHKSHDDRIRGRLERDKASDSASPWELDDFLGGQKTHGYNRDSSRIAIAIIVSVYRGSSRWNASRQSWNLMKRHARVAVKKSEKAETAFSFARLPSRNERMTHSVAQLLLGVTSFGLVWGLVSRWIQKLKKFFTLSEKYFYNRFIICMCAWFLRYW